MHTSDQLVINLLSYRDYPQRKPQVDKDEQPFRHNLRRYLISASQEGGTVTAAIHHPSQMGGCISLRAEPP